MAIKIRDDVINIYGDSLESCFFARTIALANPKSTVVHYSSGNLGGIHNDVNGTLGVLTASQYSRISELVDVEFVEISEMHLKVPHNKISFMNTSDGYIRYPINKKSFETEYDYLDNIMSPLSYEDYINKFKTTKNIVKCIKEMFSDSFYMEIIKKIGTNFYDITQSQLEPRFIYEELLQLKYLTSDDLIVHYTPKNGYGELCESLLKLDNISSRVVDRKKIKKNIRTNDEMNYIFEYYDYYLDFIYGSIEYITLEPVLHKKTLLNLDSISITITPYDKRYGKYYQIDSNIYGVKTSKSTIMSDGFGPRTPIPTYQNSKKIREYTQLVSNIPNIKLCK